MIKRAAIYVRVSTDKQSGVRVERKEVGPPGAFDDLSDDQLERALREQLCALGLTPDAGSDTRHQGDRASPALHAL
jgi:hypothetical protein